MQPYGRTGLRRLMILTPATKMEPLREPGKKGPTAEVINEIKCSFPKEMLRDASSQEDPTADEVAGFKLRVLAAGADRESHVESEATATPEAVTRMVWVIT